MSHVIKRACGASALLFFVVAISGAREPGHHLPAYVLLDLGPLPEGFIALTGYGPSITEHGGISGEVSRAGVAYSAIGTIGGGIDVVGAAGSYGTAINDKGTMVGVQFGLADSSKYHAVIYENGKSTELGTLGGIYSVANRISDAGYVTGESQTANGTSAAFLWNGHYLQEVVGPSGSASIGIGVSDNGLVTGLVGTQVSAEIIEYQAFRWDGRKMDLLGGDRSDGEAINVRGDVAGVAYYGDDDFHATLWSGNRMTDLGGTYSDAHAINNRGVAVGANNTRSLSHAYVWEETHSKDLGAMLPNGHFSDAWSINDKGQIFGLEDFERVIEWAPLPVAFEVVEEELRKRFTNKHLAAELFVAAALSEARDSRASCEIISSIADKVAALSASAAADTPQALVNLHVESIRATLQCETHRPKGCDEPGTTLSPESHRGQRRDQGRHFRSAAEHSVSVGSEALSSVW